MTAQSNIALVTIDTEAENLLKKAVTEKNDDALISVYRNVSALEKQLAESTFHVALVDIDPDPSRILNEVFYMITRYSDLRVLVLCSRFDNELVLQAMQSGARYFLQKKSIIDDFDKILQQMPVARSTTNGHAGSVITVVSASGGCGATTVAINLANELRLASSKNVLVVDFDDYYRTVSSYLAITAEYGVQDLLCRTEGIDENLIQSCAYKYMNDFHILVSRADEGSGNSGFTRHDNIAQLLEACKRAYGYTIVDAPRISDDITRQLVSISEKVLVVFQLTVKDIKFARSLLSTIASWIPSEKIIPVANRYNMRGLMVRLADGKRILGINDISRIRNDWHKTVMSINRGRPLSEIAPRSGVRHDYQRFAANLINSNGSNEKILMTGVQNG
jgi:pilus assembly protein CpaE